MRSQNQTPEQLRRYLKDDEARQIRDSERAYQEACDRVLLQNP